MSNKTLGIALVVVAIIATSVLISVKLIKSQVQLGAGSQTQYNSVEQNGGTVLGLVNSTSTTDTAYTMVAADIANTHTGTFYDTYIFQKTGSVATTTDTLPATSTLAFVLPKAGMRQSVCFAVATTSGPGFVLAEGTGWNIVTASSTNGGVPTAAGSRTIYGGSPVCGQIIRERSVNTSAGFVDSTSTVPGNLTLILSPTTPAQ